MEEKIPFNFMKNKGFTLRELMIVVANIGILAGIGVPLYVNKVYRGKQKEAISLLMVLKTEQEEFRAEFGRYGSVIDADNLSQSFQANAGAKWYNLTLAAMSTEELRTSFRGLATGRVADSHPDDIWFMTESSMYASHTGSEAVY